MAGVNVTAGSNQGVHNVVYVCTEADDLYAIDADSGVVLWHDNFLTSNYAIAPGAVVTTVPSTDLGPTNIAPQRGITATPVIDPASGTLFIDDATKQVVNGTSNYLWQFHAINISSGAELAGSGSGVVIADTAWVGTNFTYVSGPTAPAEATSAGIEISANVHRGKIWLDDIYFGGAAPAYVDVTDYFFASDPRVKDKYIDGSQGIWLDADPDGSDRKT